MARYIIADPESGTGWTHIFMEDGEPVERLTRFVWDTEAQSLHYLEILYEHRWHEGGTVSLGEIKDSLLNANELALADPEGWDLEVSDDLPDWCPVAGTDFEP